MNRNIQANDIKENVQQSNNQQIHTRRQKNEPIFGSSNAPGKNVDKTTTDNKFGGPLSSQKQLGLFSKSNQASSFQVNAEPSENVVLQPTKLTHETSYISEYEENLAKTQHQLQKIFISDQEEVFDENSENIQPKNEATCQLKRPHSFGILAEITDKRIPFNPNNDLSKRAQDDNLEDIDGFVVEYEELVHKYEPIMGKIFQSENFDYNEEFVIYEDPEF